MKKTDLEMDVEKKWPRVMLLVCLHGKAKVYAALDAMKSQALANGLRKKVDRMVVK